MLPFTLTGKKVSENLRYSTVAVELWRLIRKFAKKEEILERLRPFEYIYRALENYLPLFMKLARLKLFR